MSTETKEGYARSTRADRARPRRLSTCTEAAVALLLVGAVGCTTNEPTIGPAVPADASPSPVVLPAVPTCDQIATDLGAILRQPTKTAEVPSQEDPTLTVRVGCFFDATLSSTRHSAVVVDIEYGRFADQIGGRAADDIATIPARERVKATCDATPQSLPGDYAYAQVCSDTSGPVHSAAGLVTQGCYATTEVTVRDGESVTVETRQTVAFDVRQLAAQILDELTPRRAGTRAVAARLGADEATRAERVERLSSDHRFLTAAFRSAGRVS